MTDVISPTDQSSTNQPPDRLSVEPSKKAMTISLAAGLTAIVLGLVLELFVYKRYEFQLRDIPFLINGWWFVVVGALFTWIGFHGLVIRGTMLELDSTGLHSPKQRLSIPWDQIHGVRIVRPEGGGAIFLAVTVSELDNIAHAKSNLRKYWMFKGNFSDDEVPISLTGGKSDLDIIMSKIDSYIPKSSTN